jgi:farnesyl-diphosphate farnesyltransferase
VRPSASPEELLGPLLRDVSRSFYLTLRVLPRPIRAQIGIAYLLARATDTLADTDALPLADRLSALDRLSRRIQGTSTEPLRFDHFSASQTTPGERTLLARIEPILATLPHFEAGDLAAIRQVLSVITSGQELDLRRFHQGTTTAPIPLESAEELDDYTYRVAGCVGEFWTRICVAHLRPSPRLELNDLIQRSIRFGQGLQLVNILRDIPADLAKGRCYLPRTELDGIPLRSADLIVPANEARVRPVYDRWLVRARDHLEAGWSYVRALPWSWVRVRLGCAWPILLGLRTLDLLEHGSVLDPSQRIKVPRPALRSIMLKTCLLYPFPFLWNRLASTKTARPRHLTI